MQKGYCVALILVAAVVAVLSSDPNANYQIGTGIWDITGPAAEIGMMGYAQPGQTTAGIHLRLRARAFIFVDRNGTRVAFVNSDTCMVFNGVKQVVMQKLQALYGNLYTWENVMISGIHTHAGPAGYSFLAMYDISSFGFHKQNFEVIVNGIVSAIQMAHEKLSKGGNIYLNIGTLLNSNTNRSPSAYLANPQSERDQYPYNVDKTMTLLKFLDQDGNALGLLNWFSVHGTSMYNTNQLISGDNKGYAEYLFEKTMNGAQTAPGRGPFVAAFAQTNEGDVSPNTKGAFCDNGQPCEFAHSTCGGTSENCHGYGPGSTDTESTKIIGTNQAMAAMGLFKNASRQLTGGISFIHTFVDMSNVTVSPNFTSTHKWEHTCSAALGDAFAAGTTDGPGMFDFTQGTNSSNKNPFWNFIGGFLSEPTQEEIDCQSPKPILLNTGDIYFPLQWTPKILPLQIFRIGDLVIVGVPGEFTTMSGRRLRHTVRSALESVGAATKDTVIVIAGLSNAYSHYITTYEEYQYQRYEGGSTLYGPHTLAAYQQLYSQLAIALATKTPYPPGPTPPDLSGKTFSFQPGVIWDEAPLFGHFGDIYEDVQSSYTRPADISVVFYGADPRNDLRTQDTFLTVEQEVNGNWQIILDDGDWDTQYHWKRRGVAESLITCVWNATTAYSPGTYRIRHFGNHKSIVGTISPYSGTSSTFTLN